MPKSQYIDPKEMRKAGEITFTPIPVNQYKKTIKEELKAKNFTKDDLKRIYHDMVVIREFDRRIQRRGIQQPGPGAPVGRSGSRRRRYGLHARYQ